MVWFLLFLKLVFITSVSGQEPEKYLSLGDKELASDHLQESIAYYTMGIQLLQPQESSLITSISLFTNLGTALSSAGQEEEAADAYRKALAIYDDEAKHIVDKALQADAVLIAAQAAFFLGMTYEELNQNQMAVNAYATANTLDPLHWSSLANMGAVLKDSLSQADDALIAYNKAFDILAQREEEPTDPPAHPEFIMAELQYRIGMILVDNPTRKCAMTDKPDEEVSCQELASFALSLALKLHPDHELAKHMLATITADATMTRASNDYVKLLFDDYAHNFEHSLVEELRYTGYERLRRAFDRAFKERPPIFEKVIDAGCGTGLVGEQFRNVSQYLIGVDLSEAILREAQKARPNLYDEALVGDVTEVFVKKHPVSLIVAADSYIYFGDLEVLFTSMQSGLQTGGYAAFTLENVDPESEKLLESSKPDWRWQLTASGRFAHRRRYVEEIGKAHDLHLFHYETLVNFRYEHGKGVNGHIFILQKGMEGKDEL